MAVGGAKRPGVWVFSPSQSPTSGAAFAGPKPYWTFAGPGVFELRRWKVAVGAVTLNPCLNAVSTRPRILPGAEITSEPKAAPPITTSSLGWINTGNGPPAMAKPPRTDPRTKTKPMMVLTYPSTAQLGMP